MKFKKYQHIERFNTTKVNNIEFGKCFIFPKIDGTNSSIWIDDGELKAGSRNRELTLEKDNAGFYKWVLDNKDMFMSYFEEHPKHRIYGEWLVPHSLKVYRDTAWRKFYIFDVVVENDKGEDEYISYEIYKNWLDRYNLEYIKPQKIITNPTIEELTYELEQNHYLIDKPEEKGEGIVIKNYDFKNNHNRQTWAKIVRSEFREKKYTQTKNIQPNINIEEKIVEEYITMALIKKEKAKIENECNGWSSKYIARLLSTIYYELINEEMWNIIKKFKSPKVDFKLLNNLVVREVKIRLPEIFN